MTTATIRTNAATAIILFAFLAFPLRFAIRFSIKPRIKSNTKASTAINKLPTIVMAALLVVIPRYMATPRPPAPIKDAIPASAIVMVTIFRIPDRITGIASGILILNRICVLVLPIPFAASRIFESTCVSPVYVLRTIGKSAYIVKAMTAVAFPTPEKGIRNPSMDIDGIVYKKLITPSAGFDAFSNSLINIPTIPPIKTAIRIARNDISICSIRSFKKNDFLSISNVHISFIIMLLLSVLLPLPGIVQSTSRNAGNDFG